MNKEQLKDAISELDLVDALFKNDSERYVETAVNVMQVYDLIDQLDEPKKMAPPLGTGKQLNSVDALFKTVGESLGTRQLKLFDEEPKERHREIVELLHKTWVEKNERYGDSFSEVYWELGEVSAMTQVLHKVNRLKSLVNNEELDDERESLDDTLLDLANYCIMWLMER